jgi:hypothetical protein
MDGRASAPRGALPAGEHMAARLSLAALPAGEHMAARLSLAEFIARWQPVTLSEGATAQSHL